MPNVYQSGIIKASPEEVWRKIRDFNALPQWHPAIASSELEGEPGVGAVRHFFLKEGGEIRERLLSLSDHEHSCAYTILESPMPLKNYYAVFRLYPITLSGTTFMEWYARFDSTDPSTEDETAEAVEGVFAGGIKSLQEIFS
ncbi:MAG TPA: SRPBCC family protein [Sediminispirochaeta sp.]|nr:SRPBCC family protein [Sediminispirochaeta sp.]